MDVEAGRKLFNYHGVLVKGYLDGYYFNMKHNDDVVGFLLGFPDVSAALQRANGKLLPFGIFDLLINFRRQHLIAGYT